VSRIVTKTGDRGTTGLLDGTRVPKHDAQIEAYGSIDETQAAIAVVEGLLAGQRGEPWCDALAVQLARIQETLFALSAMLADPNDAMRLRVSLEEASVLDLEVWIDEILDALPEQTRFVRPGGSYEQGLLNVARTVCRRAERRISALEDRRAPYRWNHCLRYVNRLSDYLFVAARWVLNRQGHEETYF
jgi:cob(I)alamin adenosyltransferase